MAGEWVGPDFAALNVPWLAVLAAGVLALLPGAALAGWAAMTPARATRFLLGLVGLCIVAAPPVLLSGALLALVPADVVDTRLLRLAAIAVLEAALVTPLLARLAYPGLAAAWREHGRSLQSSGASRWRALPLLWRLNARGLGVAWIASIARVLAELGTLLLVAERLPVETRVMLEALGTNQPALLGLRLLAAAAVLGTVAVWRGANGKGSTSFS